MIVLFDLDNTIANMDHRVAMLDRDEIDWDAFEATCDEDLPINTTISIMKGFQNLGYETWIWTGRSDGVKDKTLDWLSRWHVPYGQLLMRPHAMEITTRELKKRWLHDDPVPFRKVYCAFDDDPAIIKMLRGEEVMAYQVVRPDQV